jgi:hypothetical protein
VPVQPDYLLSYQQGRAVIRNFQGRIFECDDRSIVTCGTNGRPHTAAVSEDQGFQDTSERTAAHIESAEYGLEGAARPGSR